MGVIIVEAFLEKSAEKVSAEFGNEVLELVSECELHSKRKHVYLFGRVRSI